MSAWIAIQLFVEIDIERLSLAEVASINSARINSTKWGAFSEHDGVGRRTVHRCAEVSAVVYSGVRWRERWSWNCSLAEGHPKHRHRLCFRRQVLRSESRADGVRQRHQGVSD